MLSLSYFLKSVLTFKHIKLSMRNIVSVTRKTRNFPYFLLEHRMKFKYLFQSCDRDTDDCFLLRCNLYTRKVALFSV